MLNVSNHILYIQYFIHPTYKHFPFKIKPYSFVIWVLVFDDLS